MGRPKLALVLEWSPAIDFRTACDRVPGDLADRSTHLSWRPDVTTGLIAGYFPRTSVEFKIVYGTKHRLPQVVVESIHTCVIRFLTFRAVPFPRLVLTGLTATSDMIPSNNHNVLRTWSG